jgi:hypothetical protein
MLASTKIIFEVSVIADDIFHWVQGKRVLHHLCDRGHMYVATRETQPPPARCTASPHVARAPLADSIVCVTYYSEVAPELFGTFSRAFIAMFTLTMNSVDWWFAIFPPVQHDGSLNGWPCFFVISYVVLHLRAPISSVMIADRVWQVTVNWVLFQVCIAVLLDNFLTASNEMKMAERLKAIQVNELHKQVKNPLDPLLLKLSKDYNNQAGLTEILRDLFKVGQFK